jgi:hypothetical protein
VRASPQEKEKPFLLYDGAEDGIVLCKMIGSL